MFRCPAADTLPLRYLETDFTLPQTLSAAELWAIRLSRRHYRMIDVRTEAETDTGMIPGAGRMTWSSPFQTDEQLGDK